MPEINYREASKIQILEAPRLSPGVCAVCGSSNNEDRNYIDTGWTIEWYGVVYFCTFCMTEIANHIGCLTKEQSEALEEELNSAKQTIINFRNKEAAVDDAIDKLRSTNLFNDSNIHLVDSGVLSATGLYDTAVNEESREHESETDESSSDSEQSNSKQGSDDIPAITGDEWLEFT